MKRDRVILAYGKRWNRRESEKCKFEEMPYREKGRRSGVYILYNKKRIVYIGKSVENKKSLRGRISEHTKDHLRDKWDSYTWFITRKRYASDLEALLHNIFWKVRDVTSNIARANIKAKRYNQRLALKISMEK